MTVFLGSGDDDVFTLGDGPDTVEISPGGKHDIIENFQSGEDTVNLNGFGFSGPEHVMPFISFDPDTVTTTLDLTLAQNDTLDRRDTLTFVNSSRVKETDILFNVGVPEVIIATSMDDIYTLDHNLSTVVIEPGGGHDTLENFRSGEDSVILTGFGFKDYDDLRPFESFDPDNVTTTLDLSAASSGEPGTQTLTFFNTGEYKDSDFHFDTAGIEPGTPIRYGTWGRWGGDAEPDPEPQPNPTPVPDRVVSFNDMIMG
jgi:hypothetical protein